MVDKSYIFRVGFVREYVFSKYSVFRVVLKVLK